MKFLLTAVASMSLAVSAWAQTGNIRSVTESKIKIDRGAEFVDLQKQFAAELKKANSPRARYVFQLMSGPRAYVVVTYYNKWAELDPAPNPTPNPAITALVARINGCVESSDRRIDVIDPALSIRETTAMPPLVQVAKLSVRPEKVNDFLALAKAVSFPAYRKAGVKRRIFARTRFGAPSTDFITSVGIEKFADLDGPTAIQRALGEQGYQDYVAKLSLLVYRTQFDIYRYLPDASYVPGSASTSGGGN